jgi:flagellar biogenesis protein FliO
MNGRVVLRRLIAIGGLGVAILGGSATPVAAQPAREDSFGHTAVVEPPGATPRKLPSRSADSTSALAKPRASTPTASIWGTVGALGVILAGLAAAGRYLHRHGPTALRGLPNEAVEPLGQRVLGRGVAVHLLRCGSRVLLVGVGPDGVRTLSEITDPVEVDLLTGACRRRDDERSSFAQVFRRKETAAPTLDRFARPLATEADHG